VATAVERYAALQGVHIRYACCIIQQGCSSNVVQSQILTIGDCSKTETRTFFYEQMIPRVPERLRAGLDFEALFEVFGGKLAHWQDYIADYGE
jgi:hypothetical protein